tara:strand:- start:314 stop:502 length:189 start_codon:yes stop_codon:yes gene_type:complete
MTNQEIRKLSNSGWLTTAEILAYDQTDWPLIIETRKKRCRDFGHAESVVKQMYADNPGRIFN